MQYSDLNKFQAIPHHQTLAIINQYLKVVTKQTSNNANYAEMQLMEIDMLIDQLQTKVQILEQKIGINQNSTLKEISPEKHEQS